MSNTTPNTNILLTPEQNQQLVVFQTRLVNLQNETSVAVSLLEEKKNDIVRLTKEVSYQQELLDGLTVKVSDKNESLEKLVELESKHQTSLNSILEKSQEISNLHESKSGELKERENSIEKKEKNHSEKDGELLAREEKIKSDETAIEEKKNKIQSIINSI